MKTFVANIYITDEFRRIRTGWRVLDVHFGHKWLKLTERGSGKRERVLIGSMARIMPRIHDQLKELVPIE